MGGRAAAEGAMATTQRLMTADELLRLPDDGCRHELVAGELRTMAPAGFEHGWVGVRVAFSLEAHVRAASLGAVVNSDTGFLLTRQPDTVRSPDVAFVRRERLQQSGLVTGYWLGAPDLAVEVISPNDLYTEVEEKVGEWLAHGTRMVVVLNPRRRSAVVHRPGVPPRTLANDDVLNGEDVVPGWSVPLSELFA
jgi:Uma2 family endonuclease